MLVDTAIDLQSGVMPTRAFQTTDTQTDTSVALAICLDQSGSMWSRVREVSQCMMAMADAMEGIGGKTMAFGFRNGRDGSYDGGRYSKEWHRVCGVRYDVFKIFEEKFVTSKWRFAHTQASGSTPMADGVQFGLSALNERREAHRILCVITDGVPDSPHEKVIARQVRLARGAGIHVIGVGIGSGAKYVRTLFPDHVWAETVAALPNPLLKKLNEMCDFQGRYRGRKAKLDGKITRKVS
jgi:nitric oxide reductase activation protein